MKVAPLACTTLLLVCFSSHAQTVSPDDGEVKKGLYVSHFFGFAFEYPKGWVVHDDALNNRIKERAEEEAAKSGNLAQQKNTYLLVTVSRYPRGEPIPLNPTILVGAERISHVPGNPTAKDYLFAIREPKIKRGIKPLLKEPVEVRAGGFTFFRDDFSGEVSGVPMSNSLYVTVIKGYAIVFSFTGDDAKSVEEMAQVMSTVLPVGRGGSAPKRKPN
jgi:hypothetical protein